MSKLNLFPYQQQGVAFAEGKPVSAILGAIGSGKTVICLQTLANWIDSALLDTIIIVAPPAVVNEVFPEQLNKWDDFSHMTYTILNGPQKEENLKRKVNIYLVSYHADTLRWLFTHKNCPKFQAMILDESHNIKDQSTKRFKILAEVAPFIPKRMIMTGTVQGNSAKDLWAQFFILDQGKRLFRTESSFLHFWFIPGDLKTKQWFPKRGSVKQLAEAIQDITYEIDTSQVKLPKLIEETIEIELPNKILKQYNKLENDAFVELKTGARITAFNLQSVFQKCRQMANGFVYDIDEYGNRAAHDIHDYKINAIKNLINNAEGNVLVVCNFHEEIERLQRIYPNMGHIYGKTTRKQRAQFIQEWNAKKLKVLAIHPQSGGEGLNIQHGGNLQVWSSLCWSSIRHSQTIGRLWRTGQKSKDVKVKYLIAIGTIDVPMAAALQRHARNIKEFLAILRSYRSSKRRRNLRK